MKKIATLLAIPLFFLLSLYLFGKTLSVNAQCANCGSSSANDCCNGQLQYCSDRCLCSGQITRHCSRYDEVCDIHYSSSDVSSCSSGCPTNQQYTPCLYPDSVGIEDYMYSCCYPRDSVPTATPGYSTPTPTPPLPSNYLCSQSNIERTPYLCEKVCTDGSPITANGCHATANSCDVPCASITFPSGVTNSNKCTSLDDMNQAGSDQYLFSCCTHTCEGNITYPPGNSPPGGLLPPDPNLQGWPPDYPDPPVEAYPVPYVRCADVRPDPNVSPLDPFADPRLKETEFHSLRPYQASPCDRNFRDLALYCGNSLILQIDQTVDYNYHSPPASCSDLGDQDRCYWTFDNYDSPDTIAIDLSGAEYPIMGYTEPSRNNMSDPYKVVNALNPDPANETVSDTAKVNEYVSWYLQGTMDHAESAPLDMAKNCIGETSGVQGVCRDAQPFLIPNACSLGLPSWSFDGKGGCGDYGQYCCVSSVLDHPSATLDRYKLVNLSGPIRKLVPQNVQYSEREDQVNNAYNSVNNNQHVRHNQVAGCIVDIDVPFTSYTIGGFQWPCYLPRFGNYFTNPLLDSVRLAEWRDEGELPPSPEDYNNYSDYLNAVHNWRGLFCLSIIVPPLPGPFSIFNGWSLDMCLDDPTEANYWSNLYDNIPMSPTEDMLGYTEAYTSAAVQSNTQHVSITQASFVPDEYGFAFLYVPHMDEADEVGKILQNTYAPEGADLTASSVNVSEEVDPFCDLREVRTNPGDQLFAGEITGEVTYEALVNQTFYNGDGTSGEGCASVGGSCRSLTSLPGCSTYYDNFDCPSGNFCCVDYHAYPGNGTCSGVCLPPNYNCAIAIPGEENSCPSGYTCAYSECYPSTTVPIQHYTAPIRVELKLRTAIPKADKVWKRLVAGAAGVARRMFPKIMADSNSPFEFFWDMPGETSVSYSASTDVASGNPYSVRVKGGESAKLYFPHLGGIKEYFLDGIQTLIRPKGYGGSLTQISGDTTDDTVISSVDCDLGRGPCSPENLAQYFPGHEYEASGICQAESSSNPFAMNTHCLNSADGIDNDHDGLTDMNDPNYDGATADYSIGLFQINMLAHCAGDDGFSQWSLNAPYLCVISDQNVVDGCATLYQDPVVNINYAVQLSNGGTNWTPWTNAAIKCGLL